MGFFDVLAGFWGGPSVQDLARQIAQRSYAAVRESVEGRTWSMSRGEARGYVTAKAAPIVRSELAILAIRVPRLSEGTQSLVYAHASERLVQSVLADLGRQKSRQTLRQAA
ncbi:MAG TPA: hypothetical protein VMV10_06905 [Pirellulales bacterium]|nr:hypothetical protein [Pirellulales bacterium]